MTIPTLTASRRDKKIAFEARTVVKDAYNEEVETWATAFSEWACVFYGTGAEQRQAAQMQGQQSASFEVLSNSRTRALSVANNRIRFDGGIWDIRSLAPMGRNEGVKINAVRAVG